jgi:hypothetical protein
VAPRLDGPALCDDVDTSTASLTDAFVPEVDRPVFSDPTGRRLHVLQWGSRGFCLAAAALCAALAATLQAHVSLPSLENLLGGFGVGATVSPTSAAGLPARSETRTRRSEVRFTGERVSLSEPALDRAGADMRTTSVRLLAEKQTGSVARTRPGTGSDSRPVTASAARQVSVPPTVKKSTAGDLRATAGGTGRRPASTGKSRAGQAAHRSPVGTKSINPTAAAKIHRSTTTSRLRNPHLEPVTVPRSTAPPGSGSHGRPPTFDKP